MAKKDKHLYINTELLKKAEDRQNETYCSSFNDYVMQLIKLDVQKKLLK